jgi:hypothetical protein
VNNVDDLVTSQNKAIKNGVHGIETFGANCDDAIYSAALHDANAQMLSNHQ